MTELLLTADSRGVATLTLNRPERRNAFDEAVVAQLTGALRKLAEDDAIRVLVIRGAGRSFSAGGDIEWMRRMSGSSFEENLKDARALAEMMGLLDSFPKPTIAFVLGAAYGGGVGLVACCDIAIATEQRQLLHERGEAGHHSSGHRALRHPRDRRAPGAASHADSRDDLGGASPQHRACA